MELIDKAAVVAKIEKLHGNPYYRMAIKDVLSILDTLEVKEEVLDRNDKTKLMRKCVKTAYKRGYDMGVLQTTNKINHNTKEVNISEIADDYYDALMKEADRMDVDTMGHCRLAYYTGCKDVLNKIRKGE